MANSMTNEKWKSSDYCSNGRKATGGDRQECLSYLSEKPADQVEDQTQRQRHQHHRNDGNVKLHALAFIMNVTGQLPKPAESTRVDQQSDNYQTGTPKNHP